MAEHDAAAFGIYRDRLSTATAIEALRAAGFRNADIVALFPDEIGNWALLKRPKRHIESLLLGTVAGVVTAASLVWLLRSISILASGPLAPLLILVACAAIGSLIGSFAGKRMEAYDQRYENRVRRGDILVSVHCDNPQWAEKAKDVLRRAGGEDVSSSDRVTVDFVRTNRILVRPTSERTTAPALRLVQTETSGAENERAVQGHSISPRSRKGWSGRRQQ